MQVDRADLPSETTGWDGSAASECRRHRPPHTAAPTAPAAAPGLCCISLQLQACASLREAFDGLMAGLLQSIDHCAAVQGSSGLCLCHRRRRLARAAPHQVALRAWHLELNGIVLNQVGNIKGGLCIIRSPSALHGHGHSSQTLRMLDGRGAKQANALH